MKETAKTRLLRLAAAVLLAAMLFTACAGGAKSKADQLELGRKYLTEMNYSEAIAAFTEAIRLNPDDIEAYLGRAEAYAAMGEYEKALADYDTVLEKAGDDPYTQAQAYAGRAGVDEQADQPEDAERDYTAALAQLEKDTDRQDADAVLTLKKDVLAKHAAVCITLALLDKAAEDYDALEQLGENVAARRKELESLLPDTGTSSDAENGLTPDAPDADTPADASTQPEAPAEEQPASSKEEPAASSKEEPSASSKEEPSASSKEQPAESKPEEAPASSQQPAQKETYPVQNPGWAEESATVSYQVGTNTVQVQRKVWGNNIHRVWTDTYTFSQPLLSVEHPSKGSTVFHVPAGTTVTCKWNYSDDDVDTEGSGGTGFEWVAVSSVAAVKDGMVPAAGTSGGTPDCSLTVKSGSVYAVSHEGMDGIYVSFPAIGFAAD